MTAATSRHARTGSGIGLVVATVIALAAGLYGTALSPLAVWVIGILTAVVGVVGVTRRARWGVLVLVVGAAFLLGSAAYFLLGLIQPDGMASRSGGSGIPAP